MEAPYRTIQAVYFMERGIASVVAVDRGGREIEAGLIGREGMTGITVVLGGDRSPLSTFVQIAGSAQRMRATALRHALRQSPTLNVVLLKFAQAFMIQTAHTALVNGRSQLNERLARWLLMAHDRVVGNDLPLTHEFLALMLGVRRPVVTVALKVLERKGLIRAARGQITVLDRGGIKARAGWAYGVPEAALHRLLGSAATRR